MRITLQQIGGGPKEIIRELVGKGFLLKPITIDAASGFVRLLELPGSPTINDPKLPDGWVNFYRVDDYSAVSYFYLDKPFSNLPVLADVQQRVVGVR
jgi:hypothetical protein